MFSLSLGRAAHSRIFRTEPTRAVRHAATRQTGWFPYCPAWPRSWSRRTSKGTSPGGVVAAGVELLFHECQHQFIGEPLQIRLQCFAFARFYVGDSVHDQRDGGRFAAGHHGMKTPRHVFGRTAAFPDRWAAPVLPARARWPQSARSLPPASSGRRESGRNVAPHCRKPARRTSGWPAAGNRAARSEY